MGSRTRAAADDVGDQRRVVAGPDDRVGEVGGEDGGVGAEALWADALCEAALWGEVEPMRAILP